MFKMTTAELTKGNAVTSAKSVVAMCPSTKKLIIIDHGRAKKLNTPVVVRFSFYPFFKCFFTYALSRVFEGSRELSKIRISKCKIKNCCAMLH